MLPVIPRGSATLTVRSVSYTHLDVYKRQAQHKATRYYMDEFHLLLKEEQTAAYLSLIHI